MLQHFWHGLKGVVQKKQLPQHYHIWKKARLSTVTSGVKKATLKSLRKAPRKRTAQARDTGDQFLSAVLARAPPDQTGLIFDHFGYQQHPGEELGIDCLLREFLRNQSELPSCEDFFQFCRPRMTPELCTMIEKQTVSQVKSPLWHAVRFGRVTASKAYTAAHTSVHSNSAFVMSVNGAAKIKDTAALQRDR